jgi:tetratricopeptide (TPR) repeat protein
MQQKYNQAEITNLEVISLLEETPKRDPSMVLLHYEELSKIYCFTNQYGKSEFYLRKALVIRRQHLESDRESIATTLSNLGFVCERQGEYARAKQFYCDALDMLRSIYSSDHYLFKITLYNYNTIIEKINNSLVKSSKEKNTFNTDKYTHWSKASCTQKSKKKKQRKRR